MKIQAFGLWFKDRIDGTAKIDLTSLGEAEGASSLGFFFTVKVLQFVQMGSSNLI